MNERKEISFDSNYLTVDGKYLRADVLPTRSKDKLTVSPAELQEILAESRGRILSTMESIYEATKKPGLTVTRPSIWTAHLGTERQTEGINSQVFTEKGWRNGGVTTEADEIHDEFHEHFAMVGDAGFVPEIHWAAGARKNHGAWLLLRKPTLWEVADQWFGYQANSVGYPVYENHVVRINFENLKAEHLNKEKIAACRHLGEIAVDWLSDNENSEMRSHYQIGLMLTQAALKQTMGDREGYSEEIEDVFTYADNDASIHESAVRAVENSVYRNH